MIPYERLQSYFRDQCGIAMSVGSLVAFNTEAAQRLTEFEVLAKKSLLASSVLHCDETGVNLAGKNHWQHSVSNAKWSLSLIDPKRGKEAMDRQGIFPHYTGIIVHDYWKPYYRYTHLTHAICGAHLLRECQGIIEADDTQIWAKKMRRLLQAIAYRKNRSANGILTKLQRRRIYRIYDAILARGKEQVPAPPLVTKASRGRKAKSKPENLLLRMELRKKDILRCIRRSDVPFTNNAAERDIRMSKVQQKISGCFKNTETANGYALTRSFINSCNKQAIPLDRAFNAIFTKGAVKELFEQG
jgi:transposase